MIYRALDKEGDYTFGQNSQNFLSGVEAVAQAIYTRLKLFLGEWWMDINDGLPMWQSILGSPSGEANLRAVDNLIKTRIRETQGVDSIVSYTSTFDTNTRRYSFTAEVNTIYGETTITKEMNYGL